jgi:hypothetical protein
MNRSLDPSPEEQKGSGAEPQGMSDEDLSQVNLAKVPLSVECLLGADAGRLGELIEAALGDKDRNNTLIDQLLLLCTDESNEQIAFRDTFCSVVSQVLGKYVTQENVIERHRCVVRLSVLVSFFLDALRDNSITRIPESLALLVRTSITALETLENERKCLPQAEGAGNPEEGERNHRFEELIDLHLLVLENVSRALRSKQLRRDPDLVENVKGLIQKQLDWEQEGLSPAYATHRGMIQIWTCVFTLASKLPDTRFSDPLLRLAEEFAERALSEEPDVVTSVSDTEEELDAKLELSEARQLCEQAAYEALAKCQDRNTLKTAALWRQLLDGGTPWLPQWQLALTALTAIDTSDTSEYLGQLIQSLIKRKSPSLEQEGQKGSLKHTLMSCLDNHGIDLPLLEVLDSEEYLNEGQIAKVRLILNSMMLTPKRRWSATSVMKMNTVLASLGWREDE